MSYRVGQEAPAAGCASDSLWAHLQTAQTVACYESPTWSAHIEAAEALTRQDLQLIKQLPNVLYTG
jgi:hypothetical protein